MRRGQRYERSPKPLIPVCIIVALVFYNLLAVMGRVGAEFLFLLIWLVCGALAVYALISLAELRLRKGKLRTAMHVLRRCAQWGTLALVLLFFVVQGFIFSGQESTAQPGAQYMIILGAGLENGLTPSETLRSRLDTALVYIRDNPETIIIVTGGQGDDELIPEADAMRDYLVERGIPPERILVENTSRNTAENFALSKEHFSPDASVLIVSNEFHLFRALRLAKKNGIENARTLAAPTPSFMLRFSCHMREFFSIVLMTVTTLI